MVTAALNLGWEAHLQHLTVLGLKKKTQTASRAERGLPSFERGLCSLKR